MGWKDAPVVEEQPAWATAPVVSDPAATAPRAYQPFSVVRKDVDPKTLNTDPDWLNASRMMFEMWERKPFEGSDDQLAEWGKDSLGRFNFNMVSMAQIANAVTKATQEEKEAFLWMMDTYDNTNFSWEGAGRAATSLATDPTTYVGLGTLGAGFVARQAGKETTKAGVRQALIQSLGRTGITAGIEGGVYAGTQSTIEQGVEVSAGRREEISLGKAAVDTAIGVTAGVVLGTAADAAVSKIVSLVRGNKTPDVEVKPKGTSTETPKAPEAATTPPKVGEVPVAPRAADAAPAAKVDESAPLGSTLTDTEISAATARQQKGRLAEDDVLPVALGDTKVEVTVPARNTGLRSTVQNMEELTGLGGQVAEQLRPLKDADLEVALEKLRTSSLPFEEMRVAARGVQMYADELRIQKAEVLKELNAKTIDPQKAAALTARSYELDNRLAALERADDAFGSMAGSLLRQRQEGLPGVDGLTVEKIMADKGISRVEAEKQFADQILDASKQAEVRKVEADYAPKIQQALDNGDFAEATRLAQEKSRTVNAITGDLVPGSSSIMSKAIEWAISNIFTVKTLFINIAWSSVKTVMRPVLDAIVKNPLEKAVRLEMAASYGAMRATFKGALKASAEAYKYEAAFLTRDANRILETNQAIPGKFGGAIRLFPRLINASDEFLSQINYASYVAGRAAGEAFIEGTEKGLKGKALDDFVEKAIETSRKASFEGNTGDDLINPIISKGMNLGLTGDDLFRYVEKELSTNGPLLKALGYGEKDLSVLQRGTDEEALNFVRDMLFKRRASGKGAASKAFASADDFLREWPSLKLITGQLFFRTPVRVFEEGVRLTPGLNILAPNFLKDLSGANGTARQVRANGEALVSLGTVGLVLSLYGQGRITGDGAYENYHQQKLRGDGSLQEPYTIKFSDGSTWSYRNFDPIATPVKIIINALERYDKLKLREAQGEFIDASEFKKPIALLSVAAGAISRAFIDAGLTEGINQMTKIAEMMADPEKEDSTTLKYLGEKLSLIVPNTMRKIARDNDPTMKDPANFWQMIEQKILGPVAGTVGADAKLNTSYSYDVLGNPRRAADTGYIFDFFTTNSVEERGRGMSEESLFVLQELDRLARVTGATYKPPIKHREMGSLDLRTVMAEDGKRTLYDVWQDNYRSLSPEKALYPILAAPLPDGTFKYKGARVEAVRDVVNQLQDAAFAITMGQEQKVIDRYIDETLKKARSQAGMFDTPRPY